jgi:hypothetical protein
MRYFGSKQQLFAAAADIDLRLPSITELDADTLIARFGSTVQRYLTAPLPR